MDKAENDIYPLVHLTESGVATSDTCAWCGQGGAQSASHIVPQLLGGRYAPMLTCARCNNFLGTVVEPLAEENAFFSAARVKLGLCDMRSAFRRAEKTDPDGREMIIDRFNQATIKPVNHSDMHFSGTPAEIKRTWVGRFKKKNPGEPTDELERLFDDESLHEFEYKGTKYIRVFNDPAKEIELKIVQQSDPNPLLLFKIAYEFLSLLGLLRHGATGGFLKNLVRITLDDPKNRIRISESVWNRTLTNTRADFSKYRKLEEIDFSLEHFLILRLSTRCRYYVLLVLFGQIQCALLLGQACADDRALSYVDKAFAMHLSQTDDVIVQWSNIEEKHTLQYWDHHIDWLAARLQERQP